MRLKTPLIGIFWIMDNRLLLNACPYDRGEDMIGNWANYSGHYPFWEKYSDENNIPYDYVHYPRGRVVYNIKTKKFKIMSSKQVIKDKKIIKRIAEAFHLTKYMVASDSHYEKAFELLEE